MASVSERHNRRSIRLQGYEYASAGAYFVTVCVQYRKCLFGEIVGEEMRLNEAGQMVKQWWEWLPKKFPTVEIDTFVVMPNHFHGIIILVGAAPCGRPSPGRPHRGAPTLGDVMDWFKTMTTNAYLRGVKQGAWSSCPGKLWQRNYYEHIIRDEDEQARIRDYIVNNPLQWELDRENPAVYVRKKPTEPWQV